jgi:hypothetical protein
MHQFEARLNPSGDIVTTGSPVIIIFYKNNNDTCHILEVNKPNLITAFADISTFIHFNIN